MARALDDRSRYTLEEGEILVTGIQALVRVALDQIRSDRRSGLHTALFVSGYRGSPLGILDQAFERQHKLLVEHDIVFNNGLNEDLAATAVWGTQMLGAIPKAKYDGVLGMWYGKGPGVDRSGDALKHANYTGIGKNGAVLALAGDDPGCKSSSLPQQSEAMLYHLQIPTLYPGSVQDVLDFGLHGYALSRVAGLWASLKIVTNVADGTGVAEVSRERVRPLLPTVELDGRPFTPSFNMGINIQAQALEMERTLYTARLELARRYARLNGLDRIIVPTPNAWLGILTAGKTYHDIRQALTEIGLGDEALRANGIRILKLGMIVPVEPTIVRDFAEGLEEIFVVEEKRPFLEVFTKEILYGRTNPPRIVGKIDEEGRALLPYHGEFDSDVLVEALVNRLSRKIPRDRIDARERRIREIHELTVAGPMNRAPYFCSGCPHNRSTEVPVGAIVAAGIGCHTMAMWMDRGITMATHMGGEGAQWVGLAPFTGESHIFQNIGDGTFFHSGLLALNYAVASGVNITYKILYNSAVAMTGGQDAMGTLPVPSLIRELEAVGVRRTLLVTDEPEKYSGVALAKNAQVRHRDDFEESQNELAVISGVTAIVYDQRCAAEKRRLRGKGTLEDPALRVFINERVCEGCGDCQKKSNCLSVEPTETEFGRKTQIHQPSCNKDYSCLLGDCPSFMTVVRGAPQQQKNQRRLPPLDRDLPEPQRISTADPFAIRIMGIGGTGVVTVGAILCTAALLDGKYVVALDQTGLAQKGGAVVTDIKIAGRAIEEANRIGVGSTDLYMAFDLLTATNEKNLDRCDPRRTVAVVSISKVPTGLMILDPKKRFPEVDLLLNSINRATRRDDNVVLDGLAIAEGLFNDSLAANLLMVGVAYQSGLLPLSANTIEEAIRQNKAGVDMSILAFRWGRMAVVDPHCVREKIRTLTAKQAKPRVLSQGARAIIDSVGVTGEVHRLLEIRVPDLIEYQSEAYAGRYANLVRLVATNEAGRSIGKTALAEAVARFFYKLLAYKDEYEVARLHLESLESGEFNAHFGEPVYFEWHLHPALLRALGRKKKLRLGPWFASAFRLLRAMRRLRGTPFDIFGYAHLRRVERELASEYEQMISNLITGLSPMNHAALVSLASLPDEVRGYEDVKLRSIERYRKRVAELRDEINQFWAAAA